MLLHIKNIIFYIIWFFQSILNYPNYLLEYKYTGKSFLNNNDMEKFNVYKIIKKFIEDNELENKGVIVSLSGGVDSMVVLHCLMYLKNYIYKEIDIGCVCINYGIRHESYDEMKFLLEYIDEYSNKNFINNLIVMEVTNSSRKNPLGYSNGNSKRSEFEEESKNIRYDGYRKLISTGKYTGVMLGHHMDDIIENIFTNMMYGRNILDLTVMKKKCVKNNITFYRPLLDIHKTEVYHISHHYNIPYFKDTTPDWSKRGIMRKQIFPLLDKTFHGWNNKLHNIGIMSDNINIIMNNYIFEKYKKNITTYKTGFTISKEAYDEDENHNIKKLVFPNIIHQYGVSYFGNKYYDMISMISNDSFKNINKNFIVYLEDNIYYFIIKKLVNKENMMDIIDIMNNNFTHNKVFSAKYKKFWKNLTL